MTEQANRLSALLQTDGNSVPGVRAALAQSPLNTENVRVASMVGYSNVFYEPFNRITTIPGGVTLTSEGTTTAAATYGTGVGGRAVITSDDVAAKTEQLSGPLLWQANLQPTGMPLICQIKVKTGATITASEYWCGLTDATADTDPIALSTTSTFTTSVPTNGVYAGYSATPTSGAAFTTGGNQHTFISIASDVNTIVAHSGGIFVAATDYTYTFYVNELGNCDYYLNNQLMGTKAVALAPNVPLTFTVWAAPRTTVSAALSVDYIYVAGN